MFFLQFRIVCSILILFLIFFSGCNHAQNLKQVRFQGFTQGSTYSISYFEKDSIGYQKQIDSILYKIDNSVSIFNPNSLISKINRGDTNVIVDKYFIEMFNKSMEVSEKTGGAFDITVGPLVNAWGFGFKNKEKLNQQIIDSLLNFVGYKMVHLKGKKVIKEKPGIMLDFNAIAQGYTVDEVSKYLDSKKIENYIVEIGGEVYAKGRKMDKKNWKVGIEQPTEHADDKQSYKNIVSLENKAISTSGNYRKYFMENGIRYSHEIDPKTGYPVKNSVLSVSVLADDCTTADAYATAFMVFGLDKGKEFLEKNKFLEAHFIYTDAKENYLTYTSEGLKKLFDK